MAPKLPFMPFYGADFYEDEKVGLMDHTERGIYLELLWRQWREGSLPCQEAEIAKLVGLPSLSKRVAQCFPVDRDNRRRNPRLERIRLEQEAVRRQKSEGGKAGRAKQLSLADPKESPDSARAMPGESLASQSQSQITDPETTKQLLVANATNGTNGGSKKHPRPSRDPPPVHANWVNEAVGIYAEHIGILPHGKVGKLLKPVVDKDGWETVKPVLECFCELAPYDEFLQRMEAGTLRKGEEKVKRLGYQTSLAAFVERYTHWKSYLQVGS